MTKLPAAIITKIDADVAEIRRKKIAAAQKKFEAEEGIRNRKEHREKALAPFRKNRGLLQMRDPAYMIGLAERVIAGEIMRDISKNEFGFHQDTLRSKLDSWVHHLFYNEYGPSHAGRRWWDMKLKDQLREAIELQRKARKA